MSLCQQAGDRYILPKTQILSCFSTVVFHIMLTVQVNTWTWITALHKNKGKLLFCTSKVLFCHSCVYPSLLLGLFPQIGDGCRMLSHSGAPSLLHTSCTKSWLIISQLQTIMERGTHANLSLEKTTLPSSGKQVITNRKNEWLKALCKCMTVLVSWQNWLLEVVISH